MQQPTDVQQFKKEVEIYHFFPTLAVISFVGVYLLSFFVIGSYWTAGSIAVVPAVVLLWRWSVAGKILDRVGCPTCGRTLKGKLRWSYPPKNCPHCGAPLR